MSAQQALSLLQDMSKLNGNGVLSSVVQVDANSSGTATIECPKSMVGRVIGKGGETIKALQQYTGAMIQIDQSQDPTRVTIVGDRRSVDTAASMVKVCQIVFLSLDLRRAGPLILIWLCLSLKTVPDWIAGHRRGQLQGLCYAPADDTQPDRQGNAGMG